MICLLLGATLAIGVVSSIPLFTTGILQRTLTRDLEQYQIDTTGYPGHLNLYLRMDIDPGLRNRRNQALTDMAASLPARFDIPLLETVHQVQFDTLYFTEHVNSEKKTACTLLAMSGVENHVTLARGRMFRGGLDPETREREVMVTENTMRRNAFVLDGVYPMTQAGRDVDDGTEEYARIVGVLEPAEADPYWRRLSFNDVFFVPYESLGELTASDKAMYSTVEFTHVFDYRRIRIEQVEPIVAAYADLVREISALFRMTVTLPVRCNFIRTVESFAQREATLRLLLQILNVPILIMIIYYVFMVAQLKVRSEEAVIAVLGSRGASGRQILWVYFLEVLILGGAALALGLPLGWGMCRVLGSANGFMDFVSRSALPLRMTPQTVGYAAAAFLGVVLTTLAPAFIYSRTSIVEQKRKKVRPKQPFWKRFFLDFVLLGVSVYYLVQMRTQTEFRRQFGMSGAEGAVDPLLYMASTVFVLGAGLCFLRVYPALISLSYRLGRRRWSPVPYAALHTIKSSGGSESFLMLFIVLSLSIGLFNAGTARTLNRNIEDRIRSAFGSDIVAEQEWRELDENGQVVVQDPMAAEVVETASYVEPPFVDFEMLTGAAGAARVLNTDFARVRFGISGRDVTAKLIAFDPYDFAEVAWWRRDLAPYPFHDYLNAMIEYPNAAVLSEALREPLGLREGDTIRVTLPESNNYVDLVVLAFTEYFPSYIPSRLDRDGAVQPNYFVAANLEYVFSKAPRYPYQVWIKREDGAGDGEIFDQLAAFRTPFTSVGSVTEPMVAAKNDPALQGTNGTLSLGFIVAMLISGMGFLIYWILSIQSRVLQFGIFRAMGLTRGKIFGILLCEQALVSGAALAAGVAVGNLAVSLFVPIFSLLYSSADQNIPFRIFSSAGDSDRIYVIFGAVLLICLLVIGRMLMRIKIDQAVKLGED